MATDDGEEIIVTVVKFRSVAAYELFAKLNGMENTVAQLTLVRKELLACTYVVRGEEKIDFSGLQGKQLDNAMDRAFDGTGLRGITEAIKFARDVNFKDFLDEQSAVMQAQRDAREQSKQ